MERNATTTEHKEFTMTNSDIQLFSGPQLKIIPGVYIPTQCIVITLPTHVGPAADQTKNTQNQTDDGRPQSRLLISPANLSDQQVSEIRKAGEITDIIAPNLYHHLSVLRAQSWFPKAQLWGAQGFAEKRPDIHWNHLFEKKSSLENWPYHESLEYRLIEGAARMNEVVFYHKASRTLLVIDLLFHIKNTKGWLSPVIYTLMGTRNKLNMSRLWNSLIKDRPAMKNSIQEVLNWDFDRIIFCHGDTVHTGGKELAREIFKKKKLV